MTRRLVLLAALVAACASTGGCAVSVGSTPQRDDSERLDRLEQRVGKVERELGIASPQETRP